MTTSIKHTFQDATFEGVVSYLDGVPQDVTLNYQSPSGGEELLGIFGEVRGSARRLFARIQERHGHAPELSPMMALFQ